MATDVMLNMGVMQAIASFTKEFLYQKSKSPHHPLPKDEMIPGTEWFMSPLQIRFTHDCISATFRPFTKANGQHCSHDSILDSVGGLLRLVDEPPELQTIDVVWHKDLI